jgi:hypothetical protein
MNKSEIMTFYKDLYSKLNDVLKPYGFRKKGGCFRRIDNSGIAWEIEIQRNPRKAGFFALFTVNVYIGLVFASELHNIWDAQIYQIQGHLGDCAEGRWDHQKWYDLTYLINLHLKERIIDGRYPRTFKEDGAEWQTKWETVQSFEEIIAEVCYLVENKAVPLLLSTQTLDAYMGLLETNNGLRICKDIETVILYADTFGQKFLPLLDKWVKDAEDYLGYLAGQDTTQYDEQFQHFHEQGIENQKLHIATLKNIESKLRK